MGIATRGFWPSSLASCQRGAASITLFSYLYLCPFSLCLLRRVSLFQLVGEEWFPRRPVHHFRWPRASLSEKLSLSSPGASVAFLRHSAFPSQLVRAEWLPPLQVHLSPGFFPCLSPFSLSLAIFDAPTLLDAVYGFLI